MKTAKRFTVTATLCMVLICLLLISGCGSPSDKFIGIWLDRQHNVALEIRKDNICTKVIPGYSQSARWKLVNDNTIAITYGPKGATSTENAVLNGDSIAFEGLVMKK
jgi:hypothetical protein